MTAPVPARWPRPDASGRFLEKHLPLYLSKAALDAKANKTVVNAADFPIVGDGVTDDTVALQAAYDAAPDGGTIFIPPRPFRLTGTITNRQKTLTVWQYGAYFVNAEAGSPFSYAGGYETVYSVTEISTVTIAETETNNPGVRLILNAAPGWRKGDAVKLISDDLIPGGRPETGSSQRRLGQCMYVQSSNGTEVVLMGELDDPMTTNIRVARFRDVAVNVFGGTLDTLDGRTIPPASVTLAAVAITGNLLTLSAPRPEIYTAAPVVFSGTGLPTGITAGTEYYAIPVSDTTMRIASSKANARAGTALAVSGTPGAVTALFKSWGGSMIAATSLRNFAWRDLVVESSPNQAFSFNGCFGGKVDNIEIRNCYDNVYTGAFGYGVNMNCSTDVEVTNYRAGRVRHAYTDDSAQIAAGSTSLHQYGRTKNCGVRVGFASNTSNTAWDTHHHGIYGYFEDVYAEDCNVAVSFRGRKHRARNITVKNVRIAVRAFTETDGGESWGHSFDGVRGSALQAFTIDCNRDGGPMAGIRETRPTSIRNVDLTGLYRSIGTVTNAAARLDDIRVEYGTSIESNTRLLDFKNGDVVLNNLDLDFRQNTTGTGLRLVREQLTDGVLRIDGIRVRSGSDFTSRFNRAIEAPTDMVFEATGLTLDYPPTAMSGGVPGSTILEYRIVVGSSDNSEYIRVADADVSGGLAARELRKTRRSPVSVNLAPSTPTTAAAFYDAKMRGQVMHLRNSGTATVTLPHGSASKLILRSGADKVLAPGDAVTFVYIPAVGWSEISSGGGGVDPSALSTPKQAQSSLSGSGVNALVGAVNGTNKVFTVPEGAFTAGTPSVFLNGVLQVPGDAVTFTPASGTITFVDAPLTGDQIFVTYQTGGTGTGTVQTSGKGYVEHGSNPNVARPTGYASVEWVGSVAPLYAIASDTWLDNS